MLFVLIACIPLAHHASSPLAPPTHIIRHLHPGDFSQVMFAVISHIISPSISLMIIAGIDFLRGFVGFLIFGRIVILYMIIVAFGSIFSLLKLTSIILIKHSST